MRTEGRGTWRKACLLGVMQRFAGAHVGALLAPVVVAAAALLILGRCLAFAPLVDNLSESVCVNLDVDSHASLQIMHF